MAIYKLVVRDIAADGLIGSDLMKHVGALTDHFNQYGVFRPESDTLICAPMSGIGLVYKLGRTLN